MGHTTSSSQCQQQHYRTNESSIESLAGKHVHMEIRSIYREVKASNKGMAL
jgi:hypothetical protein